MAEAGEAAVCVVMARPVGREVRQGANPSPSSLSLALLFLAAIARRDALFLGVLLGRGLEQRVDQRLVALDPARHRHPLGAIPLLDLHLAGTFVVIAGSLDFRQQVGGADGLEAGIGDIQVFQRPASLLTAQRLALAELFLTLADCLDREDGSGNATVVEDGAD